MGKREKKPKSKSDHCNDDDDEEAAKTTPSKSLTILDNDDDDDEEANEDLSLEIIEKAKLRACSTVQKDGVLDESDSGVALVTDIPIDAVSAESKKKKKKRENPKKKSQKAEPENDGVPSEICSSFKTFCGELLAGDGAKEEKTETNKATVANESVEANPVEVADNIVLKKLLRGPRYFDPPDGGWGTCYNCGEEGHRSVNCTSARRKKPCFVCGSLEHNAKQCVKGQDCYICKQGGHRAKDCPDKHKKGSQSSRLCLKCGNSGHDMFSCQNDYCSDDLKEIQCYICKSFGHLCCVNYGDTDRGEVSCYRCGQLGHTGLSCMGSRGEENGIASPSSCYKCGEEGHFARECPNKVSERNGLSTRKPKLRKEYRDYWEVRSAPHDLGKGCKRKKQYAEGGSIKAAKAKKRGGWITDDPGDLNHSIPNVKGWRSPATPTYKNSKISSYGDSDHALSSHGRGRPCHLHFENATPKRSAKYYQHRFSASRFGNSSSDGMGRNFGW